MFYLKVNRYSIKIHLGWQVFNLSLLTFLLVTLVLPASAAPSASIPPGFELVASAPGVAFYRKDYSGGSPDFVQVIDLSQGAKVVPLYGEITASGKGQGVYGGDNPRFVKKTIQQFWNELENQAEGAFCVSNGQFFRLADSPSPLPFPLKANGEILSDGYGINEFPGQKLVLELWPEKADIEELSPELLYQSSAPDIIAGLTEDASKAAKKAVGRTFVGVADGDGSPGFEILMIFNTRTSKPLDAADVLREFGAQKVMMLDGGGSTQLVCNGEVVISTERPIPQALGVIAGVLQPFSASLVTAPEWPVIIAGQNLSYPIQIRNTGSQTWSRNSVKIVLADLNTSSRQELPLPKDVQAGESFTLDFKLAPLEGAGVRSARLLLRDGMEEHPIQQGEVGWVVLPPSLMGQRDELQARLADAPARSEPEVQAEVQGLLAKFGSRPPSGQSQTGSERPLGTYSSSFIDISDAILVPLMMIPVVALLIFVVREINERIKY